MEQIELSDDMVQLVLSFLTTATELGVASLVSRQWERVGRTDSLWQPLFVKDFDPWNREAHLQVPKCEIAY